MLQVTFIFCLLFCFNFNYCFENVIEVKTSSGVIRGQTVYFQNKSIDQFLSIPYAEPPVGRLRFARPEPIKTPNKGIIDGTKTGHSCIQPNVEVIGNLSQSEDCLVLNIWSPKQENSTPQLKPVMFWIHGGGLSIGSIFQYDKIGPWYNGTALASYDVILVAANYRLGSFGFLYGGNDSAPGNAGIYDQVMAIKWVRENIHLFGGDKNQITIFGESAGSRSVSGLIISPLARGLFRRAIMESGSHIQFKEREVTDKSKALKESKELAKALNCSDEHWLDCLRKAKPEDILKHGHIEAFPLEGTEALPLSSQEAFKQANFTKDIELIAGVTRNEGSLIGHGQFQKILDNNNVTKSDFINLVHTTNQWYRNTINETKVQEFYLKNVNTSDSDALKIAFYDYYGDLILKCPTYLFAKLFAKNSPKSDVYFYELTYQSKNALLINGCKPKTMGICHVSDMEFVFGVPLLYPNSGDNKTDVEFSKEFMRLFTNFAKYGNPDRSWPKITDKTSNTLMKNMNPFKQNEILVNNFNSACDIFWKPYYI